MDAPSPIATTPEARSRQLRALKRADSARRAATPAAGSRGATPQQFSPTNAVGMGALFAPSGDVTPVRRSSRSSLDSVLNLACLLLHGSWPIDLMLSLSSSRLHGIPPL